MIAEHVLREQMQERLGFKVGGSQITFNDRDGNLHLSDGNDLLGRAKSGARPATQQEEKMWELLLAAYRGLDVLQRQKDSLATEVRELRGTAKTVQE